MCGVCVHLFLSTLHLNFSYRQGLGKACQGRVEPIEIVVLPPGASLDVCAKLREEKKVKKLADGTEVVKRKRRKKKNVEGVQVAEKKTDMFEFLNTKIFSSNLGLAVLLSKATKFCTAGESNKFQLEKTEHKTPPPSHQHSTNLNVKVLPVSLGSNSNLQCSPLCQPCSYLKSRKTLKQLENADSHSKKLYRDTKRGSFRLISSSVF